ncbi:hypothetical protein MHY85_12065 [Cellulomonas sp. ACRRI]|uniref:hypothetical protein n=1 Tax=Cellulomonas sp. ACRRI TaxID=2918188 RepID=UPI001EF380EF|nr:hypothetical protein [Cellulomonas sp. ACRRI]MCG7286703.1 hypothetical protein [Cellulomonas sp. ACRRI]
MASRTGVSTTSGWLAVVTLAGAVLLLVPGWFGRPPGALLLPLAAAAALGTGWLLDPGAGRATFVDGLLAALGLAALLAGAALLVASLVRLIALGDVGALAFGLGGAVAGTLLGSGLLATRMDGPPL